MPAYYNENNPKAAAWLRELIKAGHIAPGQVDHRSIRDVTAADLRGFAQCHFFAGIGGWSYALRLAGWPDERPVWTMSCPCQPFSVAGKGRGEKDDRHLWPEGRRLIHSGKPAIVFGEQVASKAGKIWLARVFADLERMAYQRAGADLCAAGISAPHIRQRLYWVANHDASRCARSNLPIRPAQPRQTAAIAPGNGYGLGLADTSGSQRRPPAESGRDEFDRANSRREKEDRGYSVSGADADGLANSKHAGFDQSQKNETVSISVREDNRLLERDSVRLADTHLCHPHWWSGPLQMGWNCIEKEIERGGRKYRAQWRVKPGVPLLAHGVPGRVAQLCGFGNAIVPQLAAEFVVAYLEL